MAYFAPYMDGSGIHMPTYGDRLEDLCGAYRGIFGAEAELSAAVPDYQLLSVFAKALDDVSALVLQAYNSRNPAYASGRALDLLLPQYGLSREAGETDARARERIRQSLAGRGFGTCDALLAAVRSVAYVRDARVLVNETDAPDSLGIPAHSIAVVTRGGDPAEIGQAIWEKKAPGIGTWGSATVNAVDREGNPHPVSFTPYTDRVVFVYLYIRVLPGGDREAIRNAVVPAVVEYIDRLGLAVPLNIPQLYGAAYAAAPAIADTFIITDIQAGLAGAASAERETVPCAWNEKLTALSDNGVNITFT